MEGDLLASGRDADIIDCGPGRVIRRARNGRSLAHEAELMAYLHRAGYPVPEIFEVRADGTDIVMERIEGPSMLDLLGRQPWRMPSLASLLARLHWDLETIRAPDSLPPWPGGGDSVLHLDFHPMNVMMSPQGPVVIDWAAARRGRPETDVAMTWVIMASSEVPGRAWERALAGVGRAAFLRAFLRGTGHKASAAAELATVIGARLDDRNITEREAARLRAWRARL